MAKKNDWRLPVACVKYNIGSFLAVFSLGLLGFWQNPAWADCPGLEESSSFRLRRGVNEALKEWSSSQGKEDLENSREEQEEDSVEDSEAEIPKQDPAEDSKGQAVKPASSPEPAPVRAGSPVVDTAPARAAAHAPAQGKSKWVFCAGQWQECTCDGVVRWGNNDKWLYIKPKAAGELLTVKCSIQVLNDILPGDDGKHCECQVTPGTPFYQGLNPMWLLPEEAEAEGAALVSSCDIFEKAKDSGLWGRNQWRAVEAFCSEDWTETAESRAGDRQMSLDIMRKLMQARVDPRFKDAYKAHFAQSGEMRGWTPKAYVNYFASTPSGKHAKMTEELVRSVHRFSKKVIIVVNFGMTTSAKLTPERYPRLILLHADPMDSALKRSFNFNKLRAFLFARALAGVGLDSDQFVAPGVDQLFEMTEREITADYPLPIMPVHFLDRGPKDLGVWWSRYCVDTACSLQTLRWGHAHPSWTHWALPFIGKWLRKNFRDETLPEITGKTQAPSLRVLDIPEDEDLLNVALWEEKATKQWCKFDITDPTEFTSLFDWKPKNGNKCFGCANIMSDKRFYKHGGAAKLFYTAHHAVVPSETRKQVDQIESKLKEGSWPASTIVFNQRLWTADELRKAHPQLECLV
ncbi:petA [Symbiodinium sp. CCMP2456]|nr:petA [Symbiodinium sp. CCMP2456]